MPKKLNKRGVTLVELIISIALMSVVMIFMYRLLADAQYDSDNEYFASQNQTQRIEILDYIHSFIRENPRFKIETKGTSAADPPHTIVITSNANGNTKQTITVTDGGNSLTIQNQVNGRNGGVRKWSFADTKCMASTTVNCNPDIVKTGTTNLYKNGYAIYECTIEIYTVNPENKSGNNNIIDDIIITALAQQ